MNRYDLKVKEVEDKNEWERFLLSQNPQTFLQSWNWGETNRLTGFKVKRLGFYLSNKLVGLSQLIHQPAKRGPHYLIPGGPVINYQDEKLVVNVFNAIKEIAKKDKVWFVRVRPDLKENDEIRRLFSRLGLIYAPMHLHGEHTLILDLTKSEEEILKGMRKTTRYLIRKSLNEGFNIKISKDPKYSEILAKLQKDTVERHHFVGFSKKLFNSQLATFAKENQAELFICEKDKIPFVASLIVYYGNKAFYHHSASSNLSQRTNATYFTQWQIIKRAKDLGKRYYDFWGIAPTDDPKHRFAGVTVFKKGFGGTRVDLVHAHDIPCSRYYWITYLFETIRKKVRRL